MGTLEGIFVYGLFAVLLVVGVIKLFFEGIFEFIWVLLQCFFNMK